MALITPQAARCDGLWLSVHTDDRNRYYCWGCIRFCRSSLACRTCSLSRHSNYCWHFRGCCQLSFFLFLFLFSISCPLSLGFVQNRSNLYFWFHLTWILSLCLSFCLPFLSFLIGRIMIFRSVSYQVQWNWFDLLSRIRKPNQTPNSLLCRTRASC